MASNTSAAVAQINTPHQSTLQGDAKASPYLISVSPRSKQQPLALTAAPAHDAPPRDVAVTIDPQADGELKENTWGPGLKECFKAPKEFGLAIFWPCGIAAKVANAIDLSPTLVGAFFAMALIGDVACTAIAWAEVSSKGESPSFSANLNQYYFAGKPSASAWSIAGYVFGALFVIGAFALRYMTERHYGMKHKILYNLYASLACTCCSMAQMSRQVDYVAAQRREQQKDVLPAFAV